EVAPHAIDVSSGVEIQKGIKDPDAMKSFMAAVSKADTDK
ncbi:MAG: phosphoribosylanthranilate isomerase, partial [Pseudomonadales bacterium]